MSLEMLTIVWDLDLPRNEQDLMECLAWHANADGVCWPGKLRMMHRTGQSESTLKRTFRSLKGKGLAEVLENAEGGRGKAPVLKIHPERGPRKVPFEDFKRRFLEAKKGGQREPLSADKGGQAAPERGPNRAEKGARAAAPQPTENRHPEPSVSEEHPNGSSSGGEPPEQEEPRMSYRQYAFKRFRELIKEARTKGREPDPLPNSRLGEYAAFYEQHAKEGADPDDLDDAIRWLVAKAAGEVEDEAQAWAYFGTAVRAVLNGGVRKPFSVIEGGKEVGDGTDKRDSSRYTEGYEFLFNRG